MKKALIVAAVLFGCFMLFGFIRSSDPEVQARRKEEQAIQLCWEDQGRKSLDPQTARFVAGMCEELERRYVAKHGRKP